MGETRLSEIWRGVRFFAALGPHLSRPVTVEHARAIVRRRLEHRATDFLALVRRAVYGEPSSPYRALLRVVDPQAVIDAMRMWAATVAGTHVESLWGPMRWLTVERRPPYLSYHGKLHPIHHQPPAAIR